MLAFATINVTDKSINLKNTGRQKKMLLGRGVAKYWEVHAFYNKQVLIN